MKVCFEVCVEVLRLKQCLIIQVLKSLKSIEGFGRSVLDILKISLEL